MATAAELAEYEDWQKSTGIFERDAAGNLIKHGGSGFSAWELWDSSKRVGRTNPFMGQLEDLGYTPGELPSSATDEREIIKQFPQPDGTTLIIYSDGTHEVIGGSDSPSQSAVEGLIADISESFPWAVELGFLDLIKELVVDGAGAEQIIAEVRQSTQYQQRFPGMIGPDGIRRYRTEGEYLTAVENYRGVLKDFGEYDRATDTPMSYVALMDAGIDANELRERFGTFRSIQAGSQELKDAFFVYAGMDVGDEDLYQAVVSPQFREELTNEYDLTVANSTLDYDTFIERARQVSTAAVVKTLETLSARNATTGTVVSRIMSMDPAYGRTLIASLFTGGDTAATNRTLTLAELTEAFSAAVMGSAATEAGWAIPTKARLEEYRAAGIEASTLHTLYESMKLRSPALAGMVERAGRGSTLRR